MIPSELVITPLGATATNLSEPQHTSAQYRANGFERVVHNPYVPALLMTDNAFAATVPDIVSPVDVTFPMFAPLLRNARTPLPASYTAAFPTANVLPTVIFDTVGPELKTRFPVPVLLVVPVAAVILATLTARWTVVGALKGML